MHILLTARAQHSDNIRRHSIKPCVAKDLETIKVTLLSFHCQKQGINTAGKVPGTEEAGSGNDFSFWMSQITGELRHLEHSQLWLNSFYTVEQFQLT